MSLVSRENVQRMLEERLSPASFDLKDLLDDLAALPRIEWFPIEVAPQDGTEVLLYLPQKIMRRTIVSERIVVGYFHTPGNPETQPYWLTGDGRSRAPTHWMPLPPPPRQTEREVL